MLENYILFWMQGEQGEGRGRKYFFYFHYLTVSFNIFMSYLLETEKVSTNSQMQEIHFSQIHQSRVQKQALTRRCEWIRA